MLLGEMMQWWLLCCFQSRKWVIIQCKAKDIVNIIVTIVYSWIAKVIILFVFSLFCSTTIVSTLNTALQPSHGLSDFREWRFTINTAIRNQTVQWDYNLTENPQIRVYTHYCFLLPCLFGNCFLFRKLPSILVPYKVFTWSTQMDIKSSLACFSYWISCFRRTRL